LDSGPEEYIGILAVSRMCRLLATATIVTILAVGVAGRSILQDSGSANPTSFAQKNTNSQGTNSANTAVQQALQNQKTTQLQGRQTQIKPQVTAKKTLQQVNRFTSMNLSQGSLLLEARPLARASSNEVQVMALQSFKTNLFATGQSTLRCTMLGTDTV